KIEFEKDELLLLISQSRLFCNDLSFKDTDLLNDLLKTVPLFNRDGNYYKWSHRSIQEYFAAQFIFKDSKNEQKDILLNIYNHKNLDYFTNTLDLYYDIDYKIFREVLEYNILKDFITHHNKLIKSSINEIDLPLLEKRIQLTFFSHHFLVQDSNKKLTDLSAYNNELKKSEKKVRDSPNYEISDKLTMLLFNETQKYTNTKNFTSSGIITFPRYGLNTFFISAHNKKIEIVNLLYLKNKEYISIPTDVNRDFFVQINIEDQHKDKVFELDLQTDNPYNSKENFKKTNNLIERGAKIYLISFTEAVKELNRIEDELKQVNSFSNF